ncbi:MliC family protein [Chelativorans intermedius]|uniref:MliC family protein n=1 Tax=Chelativorans intermedius TaxID=515947 RepID=A0ABV6DAS1_9HYPH|nr:MliC family protein [Chelativorans intermedius]MCT8998026.1 MliC family protein [Chelativorans intermedius]
MPKTFFSLSLLAALVGIAGCSDATELTLSLPGDATVERTSVAYDCGAAGRLDVEYVNAGPVSLAVFTYDEEPVVASNVVAASGARYAGGRYVWWSKGDGGTLHDAMQAEDAPPLATCSQAR